MCTRHRQQQEEAPSSRRADPPVHAHAPLPLQVEACQQLLPLQGAIEHVRAGAPLPHAHVAASTMYTVEYVAM